MGAFSQDPTLLVAAKTYTSHNSQHTANIGERFPQAFWIGGASPADVTLVLEGQGGTLVFPVANPGMWHPAPPFKGVMATGSPATVLVGVIFRR